MYSAMHTKWGAHRNTRALMLGAYSLTAMLILGLLVAIAGCVREASDGSETPQRTASLEAEVTIGAAEGPEEYLFNSIQCVLVAQDGTVWVLDGRVPVLRQFDSGGYYLRHVGRQGGGPGEFRYPFGLAQLSDGRVLLRHGGSLNRINLYMPDGTPDTTWTVNGPGSWPHGATHPIHVDMSNLIWVSFSERDFRTRTVGRPVYLRLRTNGSVIDTVQTPELPSVDRVTVTLTRTLSSGATSTYGFPVPYQPTSILTWSPRGFCVTAQTGKYEIVLHEPTQDQGGQGDRPPQWHPGDSVTTVSRSIPPVELSRAEREAQQSYLLAQVRAQDQTFSGSIPDIPGQKPPMRDVFFGQDGRIWVWVSMPSEQYDPEPVQSRTGQPIPVIGWRETIAFDVFESDGAFLGRVVMPHGIRPYQPTTVMKGDRIWCVVLDEDDVEVIRCYRVNWP